MSLWHSIEGDDVGVFNWHPDNTVYLDVARNIGGGDQPIRLALDEGPQNSRSYNTAYLSLAEAKELRSRLDKAIVRVEER